MKFVSLAVLVVQNTALALFLRLSATTTHYYATTAVVLAEVLKLLISLFIYLYNNRSFSNLYTDVFSSNPLFLILPALLYTLQNNLQFYAIHLLDATTFQVTFQMKIITTALCSLVLLKKRLALLQWMALFTLMVGVILVQYPTDPSETNVNLLGLVAVFCACLTSGLAGVYFEFILKGSNTCLWIRNIQLCSFSIVSGLFGCWLKDGVGIAENGFMSGYTLTVWWVILLQAAGGIIVALVVKYADNILKGFATSISIVLTSIVGVTWLGMQFTRIYVCGVVFVLCATFLYGNFKAVEIKLGWTKLEADEKHSHVV